MGDVDHLKPKTEISFAGTFAASAFAACVAEVLLCIPIYSILFYYVFKCNAFSTPDLDLHSFIHSFYIYVYVYLFNSLSKNQLTFNVYISFLSFGLSVCM